MNTFKNGLKLSGSLIVTSIICFFLCISMNIICSAIFTTDIGYTAYIYNDENYDEIIDQYEYIYTDKNMDGKDEGVDVKKDEYEQQGYVVVTQKMRSELKGAGKAVFLTLTQLMSFILLIAFASNISYKQGFKDKNLSKIGVSKKDMFKGVKIGVIGNLPFIVLLCFSIVTAADFRAVLYAFLNSHFYSAIITIAGKAHMLSELSIMQYALIILLQFIVPITSGIAYVLGFKEINLTEKIVYKKEVN